VQKSGRQAGRGGVITKTRPGAKAGNPPGGGEKEKRGKTKSGGRVRRDDRRAAGGVDIKTQGVSRFVKGGEEPQTNQKNHPTKKKPRRQSHGATHWLKDKEEDVQTFVNGTGGAKKIRLRRKEKKREGRG